MTDKLAGPWMSSAADPRAVDPQGRLEGHPWGRWEAGNAAEPQPGLPRWTGIIIPVATEYPLDILITEGASVVWQSRSAPRLPAAPRDAPVVAGAVCPRRILPVCSAWLQPFGAAGVFHARATPACPWVGPGGGGSRKRHIGNFRVFQLEPEAARDVGGELGMLQHRAGTSSTGAALSIQGIYPCSSPRQKNTRRTKELEAGTWTIIHVECWGWWHGRRDTSQGGWPWGMSHIPCPPATSSLLRGATCSRFRCLYAPASQCSLSFWDNFGYKSSWLSSLQSRGSCLPSVGQDGAWLHRDGLAVGTGSSGITGVPGKLRGKPGKAAGGG